MERMSRRRFLAVGGAALPLAGLAALGAKEHRKEFRMGAQSYSFRKFDLDGSIKCLKELGLNEMEFCAVHFPPDAEDPNFGKVRATIEAADISVPCFGVEAFTADVDANRKKFEFAKALGIGVLTADPTPDSFDNLDKLCEEFNVRIAIHNHGPKARYDKVDDTLNAVEGHSPLIGACVDTGHAIRSGDKPHEIIERLGPRVISLHLKDWITGGKEQILGEGDLDLGAVANALGTMDFSGPIVMEYEESPENPVPDMKRGWENWKAACKKA
jgi:sugar phosphate isomerase/epimerase